MLQCLSGDGRAWGMMPGVMEWFEARGEIPLLPPCRVREYGPLTDDTDRPADEHFVNTIRGVAFAIEYCDSHGWLSTRTVRCLSIDPERHACISAYCHVRDQVMTFRVDRIISVIDLRSGDMLPGDAHFALLAPYLTQVRPDRATRRLKETQGATRDGVFALLQVANGVLGDDARGVVVDYVKAEAEAAGCPVAPAELISLWVRNLAPPLDAAKDAVKNLLADRDKFARLMPSLLKIARCGDTPAVSEELLRALFTAVRGHFSDRPSDLPGALRATR